MITVKKYIQEDREIWNQFNKNSINPLFMFDRNYMEYHSDRFIDHSLLFYENDKLIAILPMSEHGKELRSHGGLTYGGFIVDSKMKQHTMDDCFEVLVQYMHNNEFSSLLYKPIPHIYQIQPAEEDIYSLYINHAELKSVEASTVINLSSPLKMPKGRKAQISRAKREGVVIEEKTDDESLHAFIDLENAVLENRHGVTAVHTGDELCLLHSRFPENIHLVAAVFNDEMIAGTILFEYGQLVHTQYMAANEIAREIGALDLTITTVIEKYARTKLWMDFGISTEDGGHYLNHGLISQKEGFGGRTNVYQKWILKV